MKNKRVGTLTAGVCLIAVGAVFLLAMFLPAQPLVLWTLRLWPAVLILLGIEMLCSRFSAGEEPLRIDFASMLLMLLCVFFAFGCEIARQLLSALPAGSFTL